MIVPSGFFSIVIVIADDVPTTLPRLDDTVACPDDVGFCEAENG